jgi:hypothetical protein
MVGYESVAMMMATIDRPAGRGVTVVVVAVIVVASRSCDDRAA